MLPRRKKMLSRKSLIVAVISAGLSALGTAAATGELANPFRGGSEAAPRVVHSSLADLDWEPLPEFGGQQAILYQSPDGKRVAVAFRESGAHSFTYPFDEFLYVTSGRAQVRVRGRDSFELRAGDMAYFEKGAVVDFHFSEDFEDVTMLVDERPVSWR
jgi:uncharacterized cupin superfamily protein